MDECQESRNERDLLRDFISAYKDLPELWDVRNEAYTKKQIRDVAYKKLLVFYKKIKSNATVEDVKKKINSLRSNFRKELKKVALLKRSDAAIEGAHEPLRHSWLFEELQFLVDLEKSAEGDLINENTDVVSNFILVCFHFS